MMANVFITLIAVHSSLPFSSSFFSLPSKMAKNQRFLFFNLSNWVADTDHHPISASSDFPGSRKKKPQLFRLFLFSVTFAFLALCSSSIFCSFFYSPVTEPEVQVLNRASSSSLCSSIVNNTICCDRSSFRTDVCFLRGDVLTHSPSNSLFLRSAAGREERIRPYTRKWETPIMEIVAELRLRHSVDPSLSCDVVHPFHAVVFSTGGYTGNVFHEFNDGIIPLYLTAHRHNRDVVLLILDYHNWWVSKYAEILSRLSRLPPINFSNDTRTHCFPSATVGLRIHDDLSIDSAQAPLGSSIHSFRQLLDQAYRHRIRRLDIEEAQSPSPINLEETQKLKLALVLRNGSRAVENERELVAMAEEMRFKVEVLRPEKTMELMGIYRVLNGSEVMVGVHGAAMTHFLFMRPGTVFVQIVPLGTEWAAETYYGAPARRMGLRYIGYKVRPEESSLWREYGGEHPVVTEPEKINARGWEETKRVYLDRQNVRLDLERFRRMMESVRRYIDSERPEEEKPARVRFGDSRS